MRDRPSAPRAAAAILATSLLPLGAQDGGDPYTRGRADLLAQAGCVGTGPFELGDGVATGDVERELAVAARWLETAHFRIGSTLADRPLPDDSVSRRPLYAECKALRRCLPAVRAQPTELDGWLQVHLFAQRLEAVYADFERLLGVDDAWFQRNPAARDRGDGPFLGCRRKFVVLLFEQEAELARYLRRFHGCAADQPWTQRWQQDDGFVVATAAGCGDGRLADPRLLHGHVVHAVVGAMVDAFACSDVAVPFWWREGLAHVVVHRIDPHLVDTSGAVVHAGADAALWNERLAARQRHGLLPPLADVVHWPDGTGRSEIDHAVMWSLCAFLLDRGDEPVRRFCHAQRFRPMRSRFVPQRLAVEWHDGALQDAFGVSVAGLEQAWHAWLAARR